MKKLINAVDKHKDLILETERYVWKNPETGYKEFKTSAYMEKVFRDLGYELTMAEGITGFYTVIDTGREGPEILVLGELDSIICPEHPESDPETGAVHSCGHCAQCGALVGVAAALKEEGALDGLCGKIKLCAVPAEELLEIEFRKGLIAEGKIKYLGGKAEFMHRGYFDTSDIAFMLHTTNSSFTALKGAVGILAKQVIYKGKAAHAGGSPWNGNNALYAATCGLNAANSLRETFKDSDIIRFHPIVTEGGVMVNAIPGSAKLESYVRGRSYEAITDANRRINQALCGAALSLGTNVEIIDAPGYAPFENDKNMISLYKDAVEAALPEEEVVISDTISGGSTDMGDLAQVMPIIHPYAPGAVGTSHGADYYIEDPMRACVGSAKVQVAMIHKLLWGGAERARKIISDFKAPFASMKEYFEYIDSLNTSGDRIEYKDDGNVTVNLKDDLKGRSAKSTSAKDIQA